MSMFARPARPAHSAEAVPAVAETVPGPPVARPRDWSPHNWPVRRKVLAIGILPLVLAMLFGGLRVGGAVADALDWRLAAARADLLPATANYMAALDTVLLEGSTGGDVGSGKNNYEARKHELQQRLAATNVTAEVRSGVNTLLNGGQSLVDKAADSTLVRDRVNTYGTLLMTATDVIERSAPAGDRALRAQARGLGSAVAVRGQMAMQKILVVAGADLNDSQLQASMIAAAGAEPANLFGMSDLLGAGSPDAKTLQQQMDIRVAIMADPTMTLVENPELLRSIQTTDDIVDKVIRDSTASVTGSIKARANDRLTADILEAILVTTAVAVAALVALSVGRALVRPLRALRDGALEVAHTDLGEEVALVKAGRPMPIPAPLPIHTTEEIGQVAHAVDELHNQALLLAGDEARLRLLVNDMFETMSRRSRSLVDQQLSLIDHLERNEEDPARLDSLFRLDHLAARLRRNSANLLVLAGAPLARDQRDPVTLTTAVNAAVSEVEDYRRVEVGEMPDCTLAGTAAGSVIHLFAELIDNALRYSPPATTVRVSATRDGNYRNRGGGVLLRISDSGLGMSDADRRIANMRLQDDAGVAADPGRYPSPDPSPDNARHMGLFVVGRLAARHGIRVVLLGAAPDGAGSGTTAEIYLPATVFQTPERTDIRVAEQHPPAPANRDDLADAVAPVTALPRRDPGSSGIAAAPSEPAVPAAPAAPAESLEPVTMPVPVAVPEPVAPGSPADDPADDDVIYRRMLSEMQGDPHDLVDSHDLDWKSVWERGWSLAAEADDKPVGSRTAQNGLPVRQPGERLVPGGANGTGVVVRDPEAVRASISSHFGGVRAGRAQAHDAREGDEQQ